VLGLATVALGEELGGAMAHRALEHLLQYGEPPVRCAPSTPASNPCMRRPTAGPCMQRPQLQSLHAAPNSCPCMQPPPAAPACSAQMPSPSPSGESGHACDRLLLGGKALRSTIW
jgi:hypothetical protein